MGFYRTQDWARSRSSGGAAGAVVGNYTAQNLDTTLLSLEKLGEATLERDLNPVRAWQRMALGWKSLFHQSSAREEEKRAEYTYAVSALQAHELATLLFDIAHLDAMELRRYPSQAPPPDLVHAMRMSFFEVHQHFTAHDVASTLWAFGKLGKAPGLELLTGLERRGVKTIGQFTAQDVSRTLWAFAALEESPQSDLMAALMWRAEMVMQLFSAHDARDMLMAFEKIGETPAPELLSALQRRT